MVSFIQTRRPKQLHYYSNCRPAFFTFTLVVRCHFEWPPWPCYVTPFRGGKRCLPSTQGAIPPAHRDAPLNAHLFWDLCFAGSTGSSWSTRSSLPCFAVLACQASGLDSYSRILSITPILPHPCLNRSTASLPSTILC